MQKGSGETMLVKFLNPFDDEQNLFLGGTPEQHDVHGFGVQTNSIIFKFVLSHNDDMKIMLNFSSLADKLADLNWTARVVFLLGPSFQSSQPRPVRAQPRLVRAQPRSVRAQPRTVCDCVQPRPVRVQPRSVRTQPRSVSMQPRHVRVQPRPVRMQSRSVRVQPISMRTRPRSVRFQPRFVRAQPRSVRAQPRSVRAQPRFVRVRPYSTQPIIPLIIARTVDIHYTPLAIVTHLTRVIPRILNKHPPAVYSRRVSPRQHSPPDAIPRLHFHHPAVSITFHIPINRHHSTRSRIRIAFHTMHYHGWIQLCLDIMDFASFPSRTVIVGIFPWIRPIISQAPSSELLIMRNLI